MRRIVIIIPELLGEPSFLRQPLPAVRRLAERGDIFKLSPLPDIETPEALYLGMSPHDGQLRQGPLIISALGVDPPARSTHFHVSLLSHEDGVAQSPALEIARSEQREVLTLASRLNTKTLTLVEGEGLDHGLVWENIGELRTSPASTVLGKSVREHLPDGDGETGLRRFIDDSINLLSECELNRRRGEENLPPLNLLWPWGEGVRLPVPNLALLRGEPALVLSNSVRLAGLARLAGYRHGIRRDFGRGTNIRLAEIAERCRRETVTVLAIEAVSRFRARNQVDEAGWLVREIDRLLLEVLIDDPEVRITLLAPGSGEGLGICFESGNSVRSALPFDERILEERSLAGSALWDVVSRVVG